MHHFARAANKKEIAMMLRMSNSNSYRWMASLFFCTLLAGLVRAETTIDIHFLTQPIDRVSSLSEIDVFPEDLGKAGANLALSDSKKVLKFLKKELVLHQHDSIETIPADAGVIVLDTPNELIGQIVKAYPSSLIINGTNPSNELRTKFCRPNLMHSIPSWRMYADALSQFLVSKRWKRVLVIHGKEEQDLEYLSALKSSFSRFNVKVINTLAWDFDSDLRRAAAEEIPVFTRTDDHDVVVILDTSFNFGHVIPYNTDRPRPIAGTHGLKPLGWHWRMEQWGATQLQKRFVKQAQRRMESADYGVWLGIRAVVEAFIKTNSADPQRLQEYLLSDQFEVAGFKGRKISVRPWNGQFRQPIPLAHEDGLSALAPLNGFIHQLTELDTLGFDQQEVSCGQ